MSLYNTNFIANINGTNQDLGNIFYNWSTNTINIPSNGLTAQKYSITYKKPMIILETDITASMDGYPSNGDQVITFGPQVQGQFVLIGSGSTPAAFMDDANNINYTGSTVIVSNTATSVFWDGTKWFGNSYGITGRNVISYDGINWQTTGTTDTSSGGYSWKAYYNGSIYLLINGGRANAAAVAYSYDGINWTAVSSLPINAYAVGWNGLVWLVGGNLNTTIYYSYDGITWTSTGQAPFSNYVYDFAWTGTRWVAVGHNGGNANEIFYNTNPLATSAWTAATNSGTATTYSLCWNNKIMLDINANSQILYSYDGTSWNTTTSPFSGVFEGNPIKWNGRVFVASAYSSIIAYSYNGLNWIPITTNMIGAYGLDYNTRRMNTINFQRRLTIASGTGTNTLAYSLDGITWVGLGTSIFTSNGIITAYNGKIWVGVGNGTNTIAYSYNGYKWFGLGSNIFTTIGFGVAWNGIMFVAVGRGTNTIAYSYDGISWLTSSTSNILETTGGGMCVIWSGKLWVTSGGNPVTNGNTIAYSSDGINWSGILYNATGGINNSVRTVATNGQLFIAGGDSVGLYYSYNGITWVSIGTTIMGTVRGIAWNGNIWVAVGATTNTIAYSYNGFTWFGAGTSIFTTTGLSVAWNGTLWVAAGQGTNTLAYSYNGINWTGAGASIITTNASGIGTNYNINPKPYIQHPTVAFGEGTNTIAYSPDGIIWKPLGNNVFTTSGRKGFWNGKLWVGVGSGGNTLAYSYDGYNWIGLGSTIFTSIGYGVTYNGSIWVAVGYGGYSIAYSYNGINWTGVSGSSSIFTLGGRGIAWNGSTFLATGLYGSSIAQSTNGITWASQNMGSYGSNGNARILNTGIATNGYYWNLGITGFFLDVAITYTTDKTALTGWGGNNIFLGGFSIISGSGNTSGLPTTAHEWDAEQMSMSATGQYIVLAAFDTYTETTSGKLFYSTNYGRTFSQSTGLPTTSVCMRSPANSSNGQYVVVFNVATATPTAWWSNNYGASFSRITTPGSTYYMNSAAITDDGNTIYMAALGGYGAPVTQSIYKTTNASSLLSASWTTLNPSGSPQVMNKIHCNSNGSIILTSGRTSVYLSTNGGSNFTNIANNTIGLPSVANNNTVASAMTKDGTKMIVGMFSGNAYISTNSGSSFSVISSLPSAGWIVAAISTDGTYMVLGTDPNNNGSGGQIYYSVDSGTTWNTFTPSSSRAVRVAAIQNGTLMFCTGYYANLTNDNNVYIARCNSCSSIAYNGSIWVAGCNSLIPSVPVTAALAYSTNGTTWTTITNSGFTNVYDICWNGNRFVATGNSHMGYSYDGITWYVNLQTNIFSTSGYGIASNPGVGAFIAPSAMVIDDNGISGNGISNSRTLEFVSSDPYFQTGFNNITVKVEPQNII